MTPSPPPPSVPSPPAVPVKSPRTPRNGAHRTVDIAITDSPASAESRAGAKHGDERVAGEVWGRPSGSRASAGRIIGVGFLCFLLWVLFDANQLYRSAQEGPLGVRRTVAVEVLRPLAAVSNALRLSSIVSWGDSLLGRGAGALGQNQKNLPTVVLPVPGVDDVHRLIDGETPLPHNETDSKIPQTTTPLFVVPPIVQPTTAHPLTIVDIGDSVGTDLGFGLGDQFTGDSYVQVLQKGQVDTGLDRPDYWNWPGHLEQYLQQYHPQAVVIMMGANDDQALNQKGGSSAHFCEPLENSCEVALGTKAWVRDYTARIRLLMEEPLAAGAHVVWVGLPPMGGGNITSKFCQQINKIAVTQAHELPDVTYVSSWSVLSGPHGKYTEYLKINGTEQQIRAPDGVHLNPAGWDLLARALVKPMQQAWQVNLHSST